LVRNIRQESEALPATLRIAQALASQLMLLTKQKQKCLLFIHAMILF
jgi:hypothetical protein